MYTDNITDSMQAIDETIMTRLQIELTGNVGLLENH